MGTAFLQINTPVRHGRKSKWGLDYYSPWDLLPDGKRKRVKRFFETRDERDAEVDRLNEKYARHGASAAIELTPSELEDYRTARALLPEDVTLTAAARWYVANKPEDPSAKGPRLVELFRDYQAVHAAKCTDRNHRSAIKLTLEQFAAWMPADARVSDVTAEKVRRWMMHLEGTATARGYAIETRVNKRRILYGAMQWAVGEAYIAINPVERVAVPKIPRPPPVIWSVAEARALLASAILIDPCFVPFVALRLFAGMRAKQITRMRPGDIKREKRIIDVPGYRSIDDDAPATLVTKSGKRHIVQHAPETLWAWLDHFPILEANNDIERMRAIRRHARVRMKKNADRHSFATYHVALTGNANVTMTIMGQEDDSKAFFNHYRNHVFSEDAVLYFSLTPAAVLPWVFPLPKDLTRPESPHA